MCAAAIISLGFPAWADQSGSGHTIDVTPGEWDDEGDTKLNFEFHDVPTATFTGLRLHLATTLKGAEIYYTTDANAGTDNAEAWTLYTAPIELKADCMVRFFARCEGYTDSQVQKFEFVYADYQTATPAIEFNAFEGIVTINCETEGAEIRYTIDGTEPTRESTLYNEAFTPEQQMKVRARAFREDLFDSEISECEVDIPSGISAVETKGRTLRIVNDGADVVVYSETAIFLPVYNLRGNLVRTLNIEAGRTVVPDLAPGLYIIGTTKHLH